MADCAGIDRLYVCKAINQMELSQFVGFLILATIYIAVFSWDLPFVRALIR